MDRQHAGSGTADPISVAVERAGALLVLGRIDDALTIATDLVAQFPDSSAAHVLQGDCLMAANRFADAERSSSRATALAPDDPLCAILAVRCAQNGNLLWTRIQRLQALDSVSYRSQYWSVIGTASSGREALALELLAKLEADFAGSLEPLYAAAEIDLIFAARYPSRRPDIAVAKATKLLAHDPLDQRAHRLRTRAANLHPKGRSLRRATERLTHVRQASAAGVLPPPEFVKRLAVEAVGPLGLGFVGLACTLGLAAVVDAGLSWYIGVVAASAAWVLACALVFRRIKTVSMLLPELGRARLLRPVARSLTATGLLLAACAAVALALMFPYDVDRAVSLQFSSTPARSEARVVYHDVETGSSTIRMPSIVTVRVPEVNNPDEAIRLLRYYSGMGAVAATVALVLLARARTIRRGGPMERKSA